jgi:hypothetical protein
MSKKGKASIWVAEVPIGSGDWMGLIKWPPGEDHTVTSILYTRDFKHKSSCMRAVNRYIKKLDLEIVEG